MKTYSDYLNELSSSEVFERLLKYGLFSNRIPPIFQMEDFYKYTSITKKTLTTKAAQPVIYKTNRNNDLPRILSIPNPFSFYRLVGEISKHWDNLKIHFEACTTKDLFKKSQIHPRNLIKQDGIVDLNYTNFIDDKDVTDVLGMTSQFIVKADISNCYPSIYSHSIAWAIVGKSMAKTTRTHRKWYNDLDSASRSLKDNETHGLIIGPHTSVIISEIILCKIDSELKQYNYIRHIDDYTCFLNDAHEVDNFLNDLQRELEKYGLLINNKKTKIIKMPNLIHPLWTEEIKQFSFSYYEDKIKYNSLKHFLNKTLSLSLEQKNLSVIYYALKVIEDAKLTRNAQEYLKNFLIMQLHNQPYFFPFFEKYCINKCSLNNDELLLVIKNNLSHYYTKNNTEAVAYCLYYAVKYKINIDCAIDFDLVGAAIKSADATILLLTFLYNKRDSRLKQHALNLVKNNEFNDYWIFCYEILNTQELTHKNINPSWYHMKNEMVTFIAI